MGILDLIFPKNCLGCGRGGKYICPLCIEKVEPAKPICPVCKRYSNQGKTHTYCTNKYALDGMYSFYSYNGVIRKAILKLKYNFASDIAHELAEVCTKRSSPSYLLHTTNYLIPVPLHKKRENWRGFNQAEVLGKKLAEKRGWHHNNRLIIRLKDSTPQVKLGREKRLQNIRGKFAVNDEVKQVILSKVEGSQPVFVIFDDVVTTGATLSEIAKVLKKSGAKKVWGVTVARS